ncbi:MAG: hypothetical protein JNN20_19990 [Betaproteobacteria bacterium]|nr:hypothetical protein [Betaproteobacteria bacterium]
MNRAVLTGVLVPSKTMGWRRLEIILFDILRRDVGADLPDHMAYKKQKGQLALPFCRKTVLTILLLRP